MRIVLEKKLFYQKNHKDMTFYKGIHVSDMWSQFLVHFWQKEKLGEKHVKISSEFLCHVCIRFNKEGDWERLELEGQ